MSNFTNYALPAPITKTISTQEIHALAERSRFDEPDQWRRGHLAHVWVARSSTGQDFVLLAGMQGNELSEFVADIIDYKRAHPDKIVFGKFNSFIKELHNGITEQEYIAAYNDYLGQGYSSSPLHTPNNPFQQVRIAPATLDALLMLKATL